MFKLLTIALALMLPAFSPAQPSPVDSAHSTVTVHVYKTGLFSALAHDHTIKAPIASGSVDTGQRSVKLSFQVAEMQLLDTEGSESDRKEIDATMKGPKVLDAARFPVISFQSKRVELTNPGQYKVGGDLNLHGVSREIAVPVVLSNGVYKGTAHLKQTDFGITPVKVAGGAVRVKDEIEIDFEIVTH